MNLITTYAQLQAAIVGWLNRDDIDDEIKVFIQLAEAEIDRTLRRTVTRATITINSESTTLSSAIAELRSVRFVTSSSWQDTTLNVLTPEMLADHRASFRTSGRPGAVAVVGNKLLVSPAPDEAYSAEVIYFAALSKLSDSNTTNIVLTEAPDLYLYGALKHSAPFLEHDERMPTWTRLFDDALEQLHIRREREEHGASMHRMRLPVVFGQRP